MRADQTPQQGKNSTNGHDTQVNERWVPIRLDQIGKCNVKSKRPALSIAHTARDEAHTKFLIDVASSYGVACNLQAHADWSRGDFEGACTDYLSGPSLIRGRGHFRSWLRLIGIAAPPHFMEHDFAPAFRSGFEELCGANACDWSE